MDKEIATILVDLMVAAHIAFKEGRGRAVYALAAEDWYEPRRFREECGLCRFVEGTMEIDGFLSNSIQGKVNSFFTDVLREMYGEYTDPFSIFPGGSFYAPKINYGIRSREALKIAMYIEEKYL